MARHALGSEEHGLGCELGSCASLLGLTGQPGDDSDVDGGDYFSSRQRGSDGGPAPQADRALSTDELAERDCGNGGAKRVRSHVEQDLDGALPVHPGVHERRPRGAPEDEQRRREEHQSDGHGHRVQLEGRGVPPIVHGDPGPESGHPEQAEDDQHLPLRDQEPHWSCAFERSEDESDRRQGQTGGEGADRDGWQPLWALGARAHLGTLRRRALQMRGETGRVPFAGAGAVCLDLDVLRHVRSDSARST